MKMKIICAIVLGLSFSIVNGLPTPGSEGTENG